MVLSGSHLGFLVRVGLRVAGGVRLRVADRLGVELQLRVRLGLIGLRDGVIVALRELVAVPLREALAAVPVMDGDRLRGEAKPVRDAMGGVLLLGDADSDWVSVPIPAPASAPEVVELLGEANGEPEGDPVLDPERVLDRLPVRVTDHD